MPTRPLKNEIMGCEGAFEDILAFFQATPAPSFCTDIEIDKKQIKDIVGIDTSSSFKDLVLQSQELHDGENLVKTVRFLIKQSDFQITQKLVKWRCLHLVLQWFDKICHLQTLAYIKERLKNNIVITILVFNLFLAYIYFIRTFWRDFHHRELERSEDDEGVDSDGIFEDIENDDLSLSDDEPKVKKRIKRKGN